MRSVSDRQPFSARFDADGAGELEDLAAPRGDGGLIQPEQRFGLRLTAPEARKQPGVHAQARRAGQADERRAVLK